MQEVTVTGGKGVPPESTGLLLRWLARSPLSGADLETAGGEIRGYLVADGKDESGGQLFAAYSVRPGSGPQPRARHAGVGAYLEAILGAPRSPDAVYAPRAPTVRYLGMRPAPGDGGLCREYAGPGGRTVAVPVRTGKDGVPVPARQAAAEARRLLGLAGDPAVTEAGPEA